MTENTATIAQTNPFETPGARHPGAEIVIGPAPLVIDPSAAKARPALNRDEARMLTTEIQRTSVRLWLLVTEAHDRQAHLALGFETWDDYARAELHMSPSRSYQLLDTGHIMRELAVAGVDIDEMPVPPARVVAKVKNRLTEVREIMVEALAAGRDPDATLREMARTPAAPIEVPASQDTVQGEVEGEPVVSAVHDTEGRSEGEAGSPPTEPPAPSTRGLITCPACDGDGKVTRSLGGRLRTFLKKLTDSKS